VDVWLKNNLLETGVRIKPTNSRQYLNFNSSHPYHTNALFHTLLLFRASASVSLMICSKTISGPSPHFLLTVDIPNTSSVNNWTVPVIIQLKATSPRSSLRFQSSHPLPPVFRSSKSSSNWQTSYSLRHLKLKEFSRRAPKLSTTALQILTGFQPELDQSRPLPQKPSKCNRPRCKTCPIFDPSLSFVHPMTHKTYSFRHSGSACLPTSFISYYVTYVPPLRWRNPNSSNIPHQQPSLLLQISTSAPPHT